MNLLKLYLDNYVLLCKINKGILLIGLFIFSVGLGATYQASHDVNILNNTFTDYANTNAILTDGVSYYSIHKYSPDSNYTNNNYTVCEDK